MKNKILIPLIAFIVACVALLFSIVTFIRTIIRGELIWIGALQVTGTALIVGVCAITMYLVRSAYEEDEEDEEDNEYNSHEVTSDSESDNQKDDSTDKDRKPQKKNKKKKSKKENSEQTEQDKELLSDLPQVDD